MRCLPSWFHTKDQRGEGALAAAAAGQLPQLTHTGDQYTSSEGYAVDGKTSDDGCNRGAWCNAALPRRRAASRTTLAISAPLDVDSTLLHWSIHLPHRSLPEPYTGVAYSSGCKRCCALRPRWDASGARQQLSVAVGCEYVSRCPNFIATGHATISRETSADTVIPSWQRSPQYVAAVVHAIH